MAVSLLQENLIKNTFSELDDIPLKISSKKNENLNDSNELLNSLNEAISKNKLPPLNDNGNWNKSSVSQYSQGNHGIKRMENMCEELQNKCTGYRELINHAKKEIIDLKSQIMKLENDIKKKNDEIASFRFIYRIDNYSKTTFVEIEELVKVGINRRKYLENKIIELKKQIEDTNMEIKKYHERYSGIEDKKIELEEVISQQKVDNYQLENTIKNQYIEIDKLKDSVVQLQKTINEQSATIEHTKLLNQDLLNKQNILSEENIKLKSKLSDTLEANQEMIDNYHLIKDQDQVNKVYYSQIIKNFESASEALETTNKSFKNLKKETDELKKNRAQLQKINEDLYKDMAKKNKEISDLVEKLNTTIQDYEIKIEKKEEEMWALSCKMAESEMKRSPSTSNDKEMYDVESSWKDKNEVLTKEIQGLREKIMDKDNHIEELTKEIQRLNKKQYNARLKFLKNKEQKMSEKISEYILDEERIEVIFICPRCLSILKEPITLSPCSHTYCKECIEIIKNENYNILYCQECAVPVKKSFENKILNEICSEISHRNEITKALLLTISELKENDKDSIEEIK